MYCEGLSEETESRERDVEQGSREVRLTLLRKGKWKSERLLVWEGKDWWQGCVWGSQEGTVNYLNEKDKEVWERELSEE